MKASIRHFSGILGSCALIFGIGAPLTALSQAYPNKPIRVITQFASGASGDYLNRLVTTKLSELLGMLRPAPSSFGRPSVQSWDTTPSRILRV